MSDIPDFESMLVVNSELSIEVVDHVISLMNDNFSLTPKMFFCSHIYYKSVTSRRIAKLTDFVQIHFIDCPKCHYLISCQINGKISIYDSVDDKRHVEYLLPQLKIIYEDVNEHGLQYKVPQKQGNNDLNLCGFFAVANAISLLNGEVPESRPLNESLMRSCLHRCILDKNLTLFSPVFENTGQGHDRMRQSSPSEHMMSIKIGGTQSESYKPVDKTDLEDLLLTYFNGYWLHLALFVSMPDNSFLNSIEARHKVIIHFSFVKEMIKEKKYPKFDVLLLDLLHRIYLLMNTGIDWEALKNKVQSKTGCMSHEEIQTLAEVVNDFNIFWAVFKLPHLNVKERLRWFNLDGDNLDEIDLALCKLNDEIEKLNVNKDEKLNVNKEKVALFFETWTSNQHH